MKHSLVWVVRIAVALVWSVPLTVSLQSPTRPSSSTTTATSTTATNPPPPQRYDDDDDDGSSPVHTLLLCRHGDSIFNGGEPGKRETFTGWMDVPLSQKGLREAKATGEQVAQYPYGIDACFTSTLQRAQLTAHYCLWACCFEPQPAQQSKTTTAVASSVRPPKYVQDYRLNERHYGTLQGYVKADVEAGLYGHDPTLVQLWRRSWHVVPPLLEEDDPRRMQEVQKFSSFCGHADNVPRGESLEQVANNRIRPFLKEKLLPILNQAAAAASASLDVTNDNNLVYGNATGLVVAHANSLRALIGVLCEVQHDPVALKTLEALRLPTGVPLVAKFRERLDGSFQICDLEGYPYDLYLGTGQATPDLPVWPLASLPLKEQQRKESGRTDAASSTRQSSAIESNQTEQSQLIMSI